MRPLIFSDRTYIIAFVVAFLIWVLPERIGLIGRRSARDPSARQDDRGSIIVLNVLLIGGLLAGFALGGVWLGAAIPWLRPQVTIAGIVLMLLGVALRWWAILTLGRYFTVDVAVRAAQPVVQSGPYHLIRHPSYSGMLLTLLGVGVALDNWASLVVILAGGLVGLLYRVNIEEKVLMEALGQPYVDYMGHTKRFIPFIY